MSRISSIILLTTLALGGSLGMRRAEPVEAYHLKLVKSEPLKGDTVTSPKVIRLYFSMKPALPVTAIKVFDAAQREVVLGQAAVVAGSKDAVEVTVAQPLRPGAYRVRWKTASTDMHPIKGEYGFVVR